MDKKLQFRISSATKSILGKDLITDKNIAIFELVKNSYDACASRVDIYLEKESIIIKDNGDGMSVDDLTNKWLFVGYSEKAIKGNVVKKSCKRRTFAGAKGIGRLACDRLGKSLKLVTLKDNNVEQLDVQWGDFDKDSTIDFSKVNVNYTSLKSNPYPDLKTGTVLEITNLREEWSKEDIEEINKHLTKLISPIKDDKDTFEIFIHFNGTSNSIENFIFDKLGLKTTKIKVSISEDGKEIVTELNDRGDIIYRIKEKNTYTDRISGLNLELLYLSRPTKVSFFHAMKQTVYDFGSIFLYNNGFRVFPYGEPGDDSLKIDRRKGQGTRRYLGTRELMGYIIINDNTGEFKETSSRNHGLIRTKGVIEMEEVFFNKALKRLEAYVVHTLDWTYQFETETEFFPGDREKGIKELIRKLSSAKEIISIDYAYNFEEKIKEKVNDGYAGATGILKKEAEKTNNEKLVKAVKKIEATQKEQTKRIQAQKKEIKKADEQVSALKSFTSKNFKNLQSYHHQISISTKTVDNYILHCFNAVKSKNYSKLENYLQKLKKANDKINTISRFAIGGGMDQLATKSSKSLNKTIYNYLLEDYIPVAADGLKIDVIDKTSEDFILSFIAFDVLTIFDNLLDNARKAGAKKCRIEMYGDSKNLEVHVIDNGKGLDKKFKDNPDQIFDMKVSSTNGAGIGLFNVRDILGSSFKNGSNISVEPNPDNKGLKFVITFNI